MNRRGRRRRLPGSLHHRPQPRRLSRQRHHRVLGQLRPGRWIRGADGRLRLVSPGLRREVLLQRHRRHPHQHGRRRQRQQQRQRRRHLGRLHHHLWQQHHHHHFRLDQELRHRYRFRLRGFWHFVLVFRKRWRRHQPAGQLICRSARRSGCCPCSVSRAQVASRDIFCDGCN